MKKSRDTMSPTSNAQADVTNSIRDVIETYRSGFLELDPSRLASIWDHEHQPLIYVAQEKGEPLYGWPAIESYLRALPEHLEIISTMNLDQLSINPMGQMAVAFFIFRVSAKLRGRDGPHEPTGRVSMVLKNTPNGWRVIHYHESALAAHAVKTPT
jgi:ketosteroid isomerase-like protein